MEELYDDAQRVHPDFKARVEALSRRAGALGADVPPLKGRVRAEMKARFKYTDEGGVAWYRLTDLVRATIRFADIATMYAGAEAVLDDFGDGVVEFNDRYQVSGVF